MLARKARSDSESGHPPLAIEPLPRLVAAIKAFEAQAIALDAATDALSKRDGVAPAQYAKVNDAMTRVERQFLLPKGLPGRIWFKHAIYAPGLTTGYASWPLPGLRQAIEDKDAEMLSAQTLALIERLDAATAQLKLAADAAGPVNPAVAAPPPANPAPPAPKPAGGR